MRWDGAKCEHEAGAQMPVEAGRHSGILEGVAALSLTAVSCQDSRRKPTVEQITIQTIWAQRYTHN